MLTNPEPFEEAHENRELLLLCYKQTI